MVLLKTLQGEEAMFNGPGESKDLFHPTGLGDSVIFDSENLESVQLWDVVPNEGFATVHFTNIDTVPIYIYI